MLIHYKQQLVKINGKCKNHRGFKLLKFHVYFSQSEQHRFPFVSAMTPTQYIQSYISISSGRRQLYNRIFNRHKENMEDSKTDRQMLGQV